MLAAQQATRGGRGHTGEGVYQFSTPKRLTWVTMVGCWPDWAVGEKLAPQGLTRGEFCDTQL